MSKLIELIIYPSCPLDGIKHVDNEFKRESEIAKRYFQIGHINIDEIQMDNFNIIPTFNLPIYDEPTTALYRGWMLSQERYGILYVYLQQKHNIVLINTPKQYSMTHYFPNAYEFISEYTPKAIYREICDVEDLMILSRYKFNNKPVFIKDYVKSESAYPEATFVHDGGNITYLQKAINRLVELRGNELNKGIVIKEQINISRNTNDEDIEWRAFVINNKIIGVFRCFESLISLNSQHALNNIIIEVKNKLHNLSNFFTIDVVLTSDGSFTVMEVGDGQVSGIPIYEHGVEVFYKNLWEKQKSR